MATNIPSLYSLVFFVALFGGVFDALTNRVPNWWTFPAMLIALVLHTIFGGWLVGLLSLAAIVLAFVLYYPIYYFGHMGAGDVKLLMAIGAGGGIEFTFYVAVLSIFVGAAYAVVDIIFAGRFYVVMKSIYRFLLTLFLRFLEFEAPQLDKERKFSFGVSMAIATGLVIWLQLSGRL